MLKPLVYKNLDSHALKNMKSVIMYSVTICFLVYSGTCFISTEKYLRQMSHIIFGADITLKSMSEYSGTRLDEYKIRNAIDGMLKENGGKVEAYTLISGNIID